MDGLIPKIENDDAMEEEWWIVSTIAGSWILNTIKPTVKSRITYSKRELFLKRMVLGQNEIIGV